MRCIFRIETGDLEPGRLSQVTRTGIDVSILVDPRKIPAGADLPMIVGYEVERVVAFLCFIDKHNLPKG